MSNIPHHIEPMWQSLVTVAVILVSLIFAWFGLVNVATYIIAAFSLVMGICRVWLKDKAPWKVRGIVFDSFISFSLAIGLVITYISIEML
ncbi:hypothetical protein [Alloscardovia criceti]|uniref:hypothetical protein n=1 Tax=Alloscardovia criceti TaxID=356828 RepID=UPI00035CE7FE|nr:hypothetical protein [Alloscardovia criceti]